MIPSESRGVAIPHQLTGDIGVSTYSNYAKGTGISIAGANCDESTSLPMGTQGYFLNASAQLAHAGGAATGVNASDQAINNVVREARALSNGTTTDYYGNIALGPNLWPLIQSVSYTHLTLPTICSV